jgi:hypothetical protein
MSGLLRPPSNTRGEVIEAETIWVEGLPHTMNPDLIETNPHVRAHDSMCVEVRHRGQHPTASGTIE